MNTMSILFVKKKKQSLHSCLTIILVLLFAACSFNPSGQILSAWEETLIVGNNTTIDLSPNIIYKDETLYSYEISASTINDEECSKIIEQFDSECFIALDDPVVIGFFTDNSGEQVEIERYQNYLYLQKGKSGTVQLEDWVLAGDAYPGEPVGTKLENVNISQGDAIMAADLFLCGAEMNDFIFAEAKKCRILTDEYETVCEGWYITYLRNYDNYIPFDYFLYEPYGPIRLQYTKRTAPCVQEQLSFVFTENGCQVFQWNAPTKIISKQRIDDQLADFSIIQKTLRKELKNGYSWSKSTLSEDDIPNLYEMRLTWALLHSSTGSENATITPMWACIFMSPKYEREHMRPFVICIDAVTGKRIDPLFVK